MEQTMPYKDLKTYSTDPSSPSDAGIESIQSILPVTMAVVPFPTPNMDVASILNPTPRTPKRSCNKAYTLEQIHFLQYCKEDLKLSWPETEARFKEKFPDPARDVSKVGLQCRYYRAQKYPMLDIEGNTVLNDDGVIIMHNITVRERGQKGGLVVPILDGDRKPICNEKGQFIMRELNEEELHGPLGRNLHTVYQKYIKLVDRVPAHASRYSWVRNEHRTVANRNAKYNQENGIKLPGAELPGGVGVDTILWEDEIARRNSTGEASNNSKLSSARRSVPLRPDYRLNKRPKL